MAYKMEAHQLKIAEKLVILNDRSAGMLTRIYNIKKSSGDSKVKPHFLNDKKMEGAIKHIVRKFPVVDCRSNSSTFEHVAAMQAEITKSLSLYYYTFADLLDLKDHIMQLLTTMETCQCQLDININYDLTTGYLNLVVNLISMMIMLSRIEDRKAVLGLFNAAYDLQHGQSEASFPRLGQMILDYEVPLKKLHEDLGPLNRLIFSALSSLASVYVRRNFTVEAWRKSQFLSLTANPQQILYAAQTETIACEYLSLDVMDRWVVFCGTACYSTLLNDSSIFRMWQLPLQMGICLRLFRDEVFLCHQEISQFLELTKGNSKLIQSVKDCYQVVQQQAISIHADRRRFLRGSLRELSLLIRDQPGLLGPKVLFVWMGLCAGRDEVIWLLRHQAEWPAVTKKGNKTDELADRQLPELLHYILELRDLVTKHSGVIQRYYLQYVSSYDSIVASEMVTNVNGFQEEEAVLLHDFAHSIANINSDTDLRALRLDWYRFQAWTSVIRSTFSLKKNREFAIMMNTAVFHLKMIDLQDEVLKETSDLSLYCFYPKIAEKHWMGCLQLPAQCRFSLSFARLCAHFTSALHDMCPEEKTFITEKALAQCNSVIEEICRHTCNVIQGLSEYELRLSEQLTPSAVAVRVVAQVLSQTAGLGKAAQAAALAAKEHVVAGEESYRVDRQALTYPDKLQTTLLELCAALGAHRHIYVAEHTFAPREYLKQSLEAKFVEMLHVMMWEGQPNASNPRRPSDMLLALQSYMTVLQNLDTAISVDVSNLMQSALLQQTQSVDSRNKDTITALYTKWYLEVLLRRASSGHMVWSEHLKTMLASGHDMLPFSPEHYSDPLELRALVQIIGPYGVKFMSERLIWHVASQITEMSKIVANHKEILHVARSKFDDAEKMREVLNLLSADPGNKKNANSTCPADAILQRTIIIGQICAFRDALHDALRQILDSRLPFLQSSFNMLFQNMDDMAKVKIGEMSAAMGVTGPVDMSLVNAVRAQNPNVHPEEHYMNSCLLLVAIAICIPRIGMSELSSYKPSIQASLNNCHCVPLAINTIGASLFHLHERGDIQQRMKEFLALASSGILRTIGERDGGKVVPDDVLRSHTTLYIILEQMVRKNRWLSMDVLEACFPYNLVRTAYQQCYEADAQ